MNCQMMNCQVPKRRTAKTKLRGPRPRLTATLVLLAVVAAAFVSPAAAQDTTPTYLSGAMVVNDTYNRGDTSLYTNLIISWRLNHGTDGKAVSSYAIAESEDGTDGSWKGITSGLASVSQQRISNHTHNEFRHSGLAPGTTRFYRITGSLVGGGTFVVTTPRSATTLSLPTPAWGSSHKGWGFPGSDDPDGSLQLWWNSTSNVPANLWDHRSYTLESHTGDGNWEVVDDKLFSAQYLDTGLDPETTVTYRVKATISNSSAGWTAVDTGWSDEFSATTDPAPPLERPAPPPAPVVTSSATTHDTVKLSWPAVTYSDANSEGNVVYTVEFLGSSGWEVVSERQAGLTYDHTGRSAETEYEYLVTPVVKIKGSDPAEYVTGTPWYGKVTTKAASGGVGGSSGPSQEASPLTIVPRVAFGEITPPDNPLDDQIGVGGASDQSAPAPSFTIYHDPNAGSVAVNRYNQATTLLSNAGISYTVVSGDVRAEASQLAGVARSVMPRFFLGDPTEDGWTSVLKGNNGGLRWLKQKAQELSGS